jgi:hypothetical protein
MQANTIAITIHPTTDIEIIVASEYPFSFDIAADVTPQQAEQNI